MKRNRESRKSPASTSRGGAGGSPKRAPVEERHVKVCELRPGMKGLCLKVIVLEKGLVTKTKDDRHVITYALVADETAAVSLALWDRMGEVLQPGDIVSMTSAYSSLFKDSLVLYVGRFGKFERIGEFNMIFNEELNMSLQRWPQHTSQARTAAGGNVT